MLRSLTTAAVLALTATTSYADTEANKELVINAMTDVLIRGNADAIDTYFADPYTQHNPMAASGVEALRGLVSHMPGKAEGAFEPARIIAEGDLVATHYVYENFGPVPLVAFDVFRIEDGKIVEHWDNMIPLAEEPNPSGRTQIDGETTISDLDQTEANKALVLDFIDRALVKGEHVDFTQYINPAKYLQHNLQVADGLEGFGAFMQQMAEQNITMAYTSTPLVVAEGNFVLTGSEGSFAGNPTAFYDLFRLEDGLIVEHWDIIADMPAGDLPAGYPGKF